MQQQTTARLSSHALARFQAARRPTPRPVQRAPASVQARKGLPDIETAVVVGKVAASAALAALLAFGSGPAGAKLDTETRKAGEGATIEYSQIGDETPVEVVKKLKEIVPQIQARLSADANEYGSGSGYPDSIVKEFNTVKTEIDALERQVTGKNADASVTKSLASGIEQQINALKAILGFD